jgi:hypothetical protein
MVIYACQIYVGIQWREIIMKIEITPSPSSDFLQRQRGNSISYYIYERHYFMSNIYRCMFINWSERDNHEN